MPRTLLTEAQLHPDIRERVARHQQDIVSEVQAAIAAHDLVLVGMRQNPFVRRARAQLRALGLPFHELRYGSYLSDWRRRNALKLWSGWPTFPMVFVRGMLIGGAEDLERLQRSGELARLLAAPRSI